MSKQARMPTKVKKMVNEKIGKLGQYHPYKAWALSDIIDILADCDVYLVNENVELDGKEGRQLLELRFNHDVIENAALVFPWYEMRSGRYEICAYVG